MGYIGWMIFGVVLLVAEILTPTFFFLWFSIGSFLAGLTAMFSFSLGWQVLVFALSSTLLVLLTRPIARKLSKGDSPKKMYIDGLVGSRGRVTVEINPQLEKGLVRIEGEDWRAASLNGETIPVDSLVRVTRLEGTLIYVERIADESK
ncbi:MULTISPECIES: NfeD family protein [Mesotoga]|jgi:membrane protein implicated in regulation of membrane protease activity|uniref:Membrane protein implicated in regulation of membrane protease activity n=1 Tax=Mesotoga prima MesG1.Ag.4.2 TaxID=660470 RepID=I2F408_9BACT|nr:MULTISPECIES: NfeD family protein [Mesotoga]MDI9367685.1 NfeD family protein [Thermotogota bacterium]NLT45948.1 NfeD family protein [Thermotogaceae bacterium]AFK06661.1 membrane protein implicated in regulation of membrane protease activity [Mesotoga prima MesG1.Ag.4.2]MDD3681291.1 NfeD family protein [Mesotoga sp.]MDD4207482.1 NfeD family protein [Mesotoga sp.]